MEKNFLNFNVNIGRKKPENIINTDAACPFCDRSQLTNIIDSQGDILLIENKYNGVIKLSPNNSKNALRLYYSRFGDGVIEMLQDVRTIDHRLVFGRMEVGFHAFSLPLIDTSF